MNNTVYKVWFLYDDCSPNFYFKYFNSLNSFKTSFGNEIILLIKIIKNLSQSKAHFIFTNRKFPSTPW